MLATKFGGKLNRPTQTIFFLSDRNSNVSWLHLKDNNTISLLNGLEHRQQWNCYINMQTAMLLQIT